MEKIVLIDGHSILNRAFYGIPMLTNHEGIHTNAIYGFINIMLRAMEDEKSDHIAVAFDLKAPTFRPWKKTPCVLCSKLNKRDQTIFSQMLSHGLHGTAVIPDQKFIVIIRGKAPPVSPFIPVSVSAGLPRQLSHLNVYRCNPLLFSPEWNIYSPYVDSPSVLYIPSPCPFAD